MSDTYDLSGLGEGQLPERQSKRPGKEERLSSPTGRLSGRAVRNATRPSKWVEAGNYHRKTITLPPEQVAYIDELRKKERVGVLAFYRWLIDRGLKAYEEGERPEPDGPAHGVKMEHWSSNIE